MAIKFVARSLSGRLEWRLLSVGLLRKSRKYKKDLQAAASLRNFMTGRLWEMEAVLTELMTIYVEGSADQLDLAYKKTEEALAELRQELERIREPS